MKKRNRNTPALGTNAAKHYRAIADAARSAQLESSWGRAMKRASNGDRPRDGVKLLVSWDVAFRRARGA